MTAPPPCAPSRPAALLDLLLPGCVRRLRGARARLVRRMRGPLVRRRGRCCPAGRRWSRSALPRAAAHRPAGLQGAGPARPGRARWPALLAGALAPQALASPGGRRRAAGGSSRPRRGPAAARARGGDHVLRLCRHLARGDPRLRVGPGARAGPAGARLGRAGRRRRGRRTSRVGCGATRGLPPAGRGGAARRRRRHHRARRCGRAGAPSRGRAGTLRPPSCSPTRHADKIKKYPIGRRKNYSLSHLHRSGSLDPRSVAGL